jgi:hypothetical protein
MASSSSLGSVASVRTDVSQERIASIIRVTTIGQLGTTLAVISNRSTLWSYYLLLMLFLASRFLSPRWWRLYVSPKHRSLQEPHGVTSKKTAFFMFRLVCLISVPINTKKNYLNCEVWEGDSISNLTVCIRNTITFSLNVERPKYYCLASQGVRTRLTCQSFRKCLRFELLVNALRETNYCTRPLSTEHLCSCAQQVTVTWSRDTAATGLNCACAREILSGLET